MMLQQDQPAVEVRNQAEQLECELLDLIANARRKLPVEVTQEALDKIALEFDHKSKVRAEEILVENYMERVFRLLESNCKNLKEHGVQWVDIWQEVIVSLVVKGKITSFKGESRFFSFLSTVCIRRAIGIDRAMKKRKEVQVTVTDDGKGWEESVELRGSKTGSSVSTESSVVVQVVMIREESEFLHQVLEMLSEKARKLIMLRDFSQLNFKEIGLRIGESESTARRQHKRAIENLTEKYKDVANVRRLDNGA